MQGELFLGILAILGTIGGGVVTWLRFRKKDSGDAASSATAAAASAVEIIRKTMELEKASHDDKIAEHEERIARLEQIIIELREENKRKDNTIRNQSRWISALVEQVVKEGAEPIMWEEIQNLDGPEGNKPHPNGFY